MPRILINYRREDSAAYAGRLFDPLSDYFGHDNIFIDIDAIKPGQDFIQTISSTIMASGSTASTSASHRPSSARSGST